MELYYTADSKRLSTEDIQELNASLFEGWEDGGMPFNDIDNPIEGLSVITEEEFINMEIGE